MLLVQSFNILVEKNKFEFENIMIKQQNLWFKNWIVISKEEIYKISF